MKNRDISHTSSSHTTSTAAPINTTRHAGRPRPSENLSDRAWALAGNRRGSRSRAMSAIATITSDTPSRAQRRPATRRCPADVAGRRGRGRGDIRATRRRGDQQHDHGDHAARRLVKHRHTTRPVPIVARSRRGRPAIGAVQWRSASSASRSSDACSFSVVVRTGPREPLRIGQSRPVVGVGDPGAGVVQRLELPTPQLPERPFAAIDGVQAIRRASANSTTWFSRTPPLVSVVVKTVTEAADPLPGFGVREVVVAVPSRLVRGVGDQLEDLEVRRPRSRGSRSPPAGRRCRMTSSSRRYCVR